MSSQRSIPHDIIADPASEELICMHEAGHALVSIDCGIVPNLIEIVGPPFFARTNTPPTGDNGPVISLGGFASELRLFLADRLVNQQGRQISEGGFIDLACGGNAQMDKEGYFGKDYSVGGSWPAKMDTEFMEFARKVATHMNMQRAEVLARALLNERSINAMRIEALLCL
jgi:hypothetical protein